MKHPFHFPSGMSVHAVILITLCAAARADVASSPSAKTKMRDAATHEYLERALRYSRTIDPMRDMQAVEGEDPSKHNQPENLLTTSDIISFNGYTTLVPKRAILAIPPQYRSRIGEHVPGHKVVTWRDFHTLNRGWISTMEVSRIQAEGNAPLSEGTLSVMAKPSNLIVATLHGGPISVLPLKEPVEPEDAATQASAKP